MDIIKFKISENTSLLIDGIDFSGSLFISPVINGEDIIAGKFDNDALMVLPEWVRCAKASGKYLLFTSLIGISDEGGWRLCDVNHDAGLVSIKIPYNDIVLKYIFEEKSFVNSIKSLANDVYLLLAKKPHLYLAPKNVVFPE